MTEHTSRNSITIVQNGIEFSVIKPSVDISGILSNGLYFNENEQREAGTCINAVDIDWGNARIDENTRINTTGELLQYIKSHASEGGIDSEQLAEIQNKIDLYQTVFNSVLTKNYADEHYQAKGDYVGSAEYESDMAALNSALEDIRTSINGIDLSELSGKIDQLEQAQQNFLTANDVQTIVNNRVEEIIGEAPEALDTLKEIADKLGDDDNALAAITNTLAEKVNSEDVYDKETVDLIINGLSETIEAQNQQIASLQSDNAALLERLINLERKVSYLKPEEPEDESYNVIVPASNEPLTLEEIIASVNTSAEKPEAVQSLNMSTLSNPTDTYLVYPLSWEIIENDQIVSPIIKDWNGFEIGFNVNEDTPTVMVDDIEYRVSDIKLGKGSYTIEFK